MKLRRTFLSFIGLLLILFLLGEGYILTKRHKVTDSHIFMTIRSLFGKNFPIGGLLSDGSLLLFGFESPKELLVWKSLAASMVQTSEYKAQGFQSAKVTFYAQSKISTITLGDLSKARQPISFWNEHEAFQFHVANPQSKKIRLKFKVADIWGKKFERMIDVQGSGGQIFTFPISKMEKDIQTHQVDQISFSLPMQKEDTILYFDDIRLLPNKNPGTSPSKVPTQNLETGLHPLKPIDYGFKERKPYWLQREDPASTAPSTVRIPFIIKNETQVFCRLCAVEGSIPFAMGELSNPSQVRLINPGGDLVPFQTRILTSWPDGSIKWLGLHFDATVAPTEGLGYFLDYGPNIQALVPPAGIQLNESEGQLEINTGPALFRLNKKTFYLFDQVFVDTNDNKLFDPEELITEKSRLSLSFRSKEHTADRDKNSYKIEIEEKGSLKTVIRASGWFQAEGGSRFCKVIIRYYFYYGKSQVKVSHTLIYTGFPENPYLDPMIKSKLPKNETIESFSILMPYHLTAPETDQSILIGKEDFQEFGFSPALSMSLFQDKWDNAILSGAGLSETTTANAAGWIDISDNSKGINIGLRRFRENFPKAFKINTSQQEIQIDLWPKEAGEINLATTEAAFGPEARGRGSAYGLAKTHEILFNFHRGNFQQAEAGHFAHAFSERLLIRNNPYWVDATGVLGRLFPVDSRYQDQEKILERLFDWADRQKKAFQWYGMIDFGDTLTWYRNADEENQYPGFGWHPTGRWGWYNCEGVGTFTGALLQFVRSGNWKYFRFGEDQARHIMDIDTVHFNPVTNDSRLNKVLTDEFSQIGSMHQSNGNHWGGRNETASHTNVTGILLYYQLTGDERALDVAKEIGEFFLNEPFTYTKHPDEAPVQALANALWGDVLLYQQTRDKRFKEAADKLVDIFLKGQQEDGSFLEIYDPKNHLWSGEKQVIPMTDYLTSAFIAYHELTQDEKVKTMFIKMVRYLAQFEYAAPSIMHGMAYGYLITREPFFLAVLEKTLGYIQTQSISSSDPILDGLISDKPTFNRPRVYLSTLPYAFGALEEGFQEKQRT